MTWKAGDSVSLPIWLYGPTGLALTFANVAAFNAAGWVLSWIQGAAILSTQPTYTITPDPTSAGLDGRHFLTYALPAGVSSIDVQMPTGAFYSFDQVQIVCSNDEDSLAAGFARGSAVTSSNVTTSTLADQSCTEGDGFAFLLPAVLPSQLAFYDATNKTITTFATLADISATAWTVACQARRIENNGELPTVPVAFSLLAAIQSKSGNTLVVGWDAPPTGCQIDDIQGTATAALSGGGIGSITVTAGGVYFGSAPTVSIAGTGTGATATAVLTNGIVTAITVTNAGTGYTGTPTVTLSSNPATAAASRRFLCDVQLVPPSTAGFSTTKLTVFSFGLVLLRQQTTTP